MVRAVVQRTVSSRVKVKNEFIAEIGPGLTVLLAVKKGDTIKDADYIMDKIFNLRIFEDSEGKMNLSLLETGGALLLVSQFTLYGDARKGRRPGFSDAEDPEPARAMIDYCFERARLKGIEVATGQFGGEMLVQINNHGPVTILLDSEKLI